MPRLGGWRELSRARSEPAAGGGRERVMEAIEALGRRARDRRQPSVSPPGGRLVGHVVPDPRGPEPPGSLDALGSLPGRARNGGSRAVAGLPADGGGGGHDGAGDGGAGAAAWQEPVACASLTRAQLVMNRAENPDWSVRERVSARAGALHMARVGRRAHKLNSAPAELAVAESDNECVLPRDPKGKKKKKKDEEEEEEEDEEDE